jgi:hypothetical protein
MPDDDSSAHFADFVAACEAQIRKAPGFENVADWREIDYGKGAAALVVAARHVPFGACDMHVSDPRNPAFVVLRDTLEALASRVVRATV